MTQFLFGVISLKFKSSSEMTGMSGVASFRTYAYSPKAIGVVIKIFDNIVLPTFRAWCFC